jgi:FtsZ-binding cell division protein ZapB
MWLDPETLKIIIATDVALGIVMFALGIATIDLAHRIFPDEAETLSRENKALRRENEALRNDNDAFKQASLDAWNQLDDMRDAMRTIMASVESVADADSDTAGDEED